MFRGAFQSWRRWSDDRIIRKHLEGERLRSGEKEPLRIADLTKHHSELKTVIRSARDFVCIHPVKAAV
jgi:hypothetical protein